MIRRMLPIFVALVLIGIETTGVQAQFGPAIGPSPNYTPPPVGQPSPFPPITVPTLKGVRPHQQELHRLRALLVIDSNSNLRNSVLKDMGTMRNLLTRGIPAGRLDLTILQGNDATPANVLAYYRNLNTGPHESVLFYYAGHGGVQNHRYFLAMTAGSLDRETLFKAMTARNPGLTVLLTDSCSTIVPARGAGNVASSSDANAAQSRNMQQLGRNLFLQHRGIVDKTAALHGSPAYGDDEIGGFFTASLGQVFATPGRFNGGQGFVTWDMFDLQVNDVLCRGISFPRSQKVQLSFRFPR